MPPRTTRKSYRPRVSDRTMVGPLQPPCLSVSDTEWRRHRRKMKPLGWKNKSTCRISPRVKSLRRQARKNPSFITWAGKSENIRPQEGCFFLTSPFIELLRTWSKGWKRQPSHELRSHAQAASQLVKQLRTPTEPTPRSHPPLNRRRSPSPTSHPTSNPYAA